MIDQEELKRLLHYDPDTGVFTWKVRVATRVAIGDVAGSLYRKGSYRRVCVSGKVYAAHRLVWFYMTGEWPNGNIDHINGVKSDNRWCNLRVVTQQQNTMNSSSRKNSSSKYKGVSFNKKVKKWQSRVCVIGVEYHIGYFDSEEEAALAYNKQAINLHGEYAKLNEV